MKSWLHARCHNDLMHSSVCIKALLPVFKVRLQVTARHAEGADRGQRAGHRQLVQQLVHQDAGPAACLQLQPGPVQRAEVPLLEEATQAAGAEGVSAWRIERLHQRLQADVAHQIVVHFQTVVVKVVFPAAVDLATLGTQSLQSWLHGPSQTHLGARAAHVFSFNAIQLWHDWVQLGCRAVGKGRTHSYPISFRGWTGGGEDKCPPVADGTSPCGSEAKTRELNSCFRKKNKTTSVGHLFMWQILCARVPTCLHETEDDTACVCVCVHVYVTAEIMYCCFCPLIWQYNLSFALACSNLPIPQRGNYLGLRQKEGTDQRKWAWESNRKGKWCRQDTEGSVDRWKKKKKKRSMGCENRYKGRIRIWNGRKDERKGGEAKENAWYFWFRLGTVDELSLLYNGKRTRPKQSLEI